MKNQSLLAMALMLAACGDKHTAIEGYAHGIAVIDSDYHSTALTLLDPNNDAVTDPCLTSGSVSPRLSLALSGDVVLPTFVGAANALPLVDRTNGAVVWVDPNTCTVQNQLAVAPGFDGNPHDIATISPTKAYVTLFSSAAQGESGNGIVIINPQTSALTGNIIVSTLATRDSNGVTTLARPDRALLVGDVVYVTLGNISADYSSYGPGRVLVIDSNTNQIALHLDLTEGRGCSGMATAGNVLAIGCDGDTSNPNLTTHSALYIYDVSNVRAPVLTQTVTAEQLQRQSIFSNALSVHGGHVYFVATADMDAVYQDTTLLVSASGPFEMGGLVSAGDNLYVSDASARDPAILEISAGSVTRRITSAPKSLLPPRSLVAY